MRSIDDKVYFRLGIFEGFDKVRNFRILILLDYIKVRKLLKYDWFEKMVYVILGFYCVFMKLSVMNEIEEKLIIEDDCYYVFVWFKVIVGLLGIVWVSEMVCLWYEDLLVFEVDELIFGSL